MADPTLEETEQLRNSYLEYLQDVGETSVHPNDLNRLKSDNHYVGRFLVHHDNNQELALKMIKNTFEWRKNENINEINSETVKIEYMVEGGFFSRGRDKDGCALLILKCIKHVRSDKRDMNEIKRCLLYWFEKLEREENGKLISIFFDMENCGLSQMDMDFTKYIIGLFKEYYPNFLNYIIIYEMAWILNTAFSVIKNWLPEKAVQKIKRLKKHDIFTYVPKEQALKCWGGLDDYTFSFLPETSEKPMTIAPSDKKVHFEANCNNNKPLSDSSMSDQGVLDSSGLSVSPASIITFVKDGKEFISTLELKNVSADTNLSYKIKTTAPEKFRVRPSVGLLLPGNVVNVVITLLPGYHIGGLSKDKFQIMSLPVQTDRMSSDEQLDLWKNTSGKSVTQHRLRCAQTSPLPTRNGNATNYAGAGGEGSDLMAISSSVSRLQVAQEGLARTTQQLKQLQIVTIVLLAIIAMALFHMVLKYSGDSDSQNAVCQQLPNAEL